MTPAQLIIWSAMEERQRDAWVARHIFGYKPFADENGKPLPDECDTPWWQTSIWETPWGNVIMRDSPDGIPHYSTSLDAIWSGVEQLRHKMMASRLTDQGLMTRYQRFTQALSRTPLYTLNSVQAARALCELLLDAYEIEVTAP